MHSTPKKLSSPVVPQREPSAMETGPTTPKEPFAWKASKLVSPSPSVQTSALAATLAPLPVVAIGGIGPREAAQVMAAQGPAGSAADGIAVVSAICGASDPEAAARTLRREIDTGREVAAVRPSGVGPS